MRKILIIGISVIVALFIGCTILGRQIPIHRSNLQIDSYRIYYLETSKMIQCDLAYFEVVVDEDEDFQYIYELISIGNGSCKSELYLWDQLKFYTISDAIEYGIVSIEDFIASEFVIKRPLVIE